MTVRAIFIADGSSDLPLAEHLRELCFERGLDITIDTPDPARLGATTRTVADRLRAVRGMDDGFDAAFVHRDAEGQAVQHRRTEIKAGATDAGVDQHVIPVIPVRMTEAWLLLDEETIREVAGRPKGRTALGLPRPHEVEHVADPKAVLRAALLAASGSAGRRRVQVARDFERHRAILLRRLDRSGPVSALPSWKALLHDVDELCDRFPEHRT